MTGDRIQISPATIYGEGLETGRLRYQHCAGCDRAVFFPRVACPHCGSVLLQWRDSSGAGTVYSTTMVRSRSGDYNVALIDLDEGFRMMCSVRSDDDGEVRIGGRVTAVVPEGTTAESLYFVQRPPTTDEDAAGKRA